MATEIEEFYKLKRKIFEENNKRDLYSIINEIEMYKQKVDKEKFKEIEKVANDICNDRFDCKKLGIEYSRITNKEFNSLLLTLLKIEEVWNIEKKKGI